MAKRGCPCQRAKHRPIPKASKNPYRRGWKDFIRGEWWIDSSGESMFADIDIGDEGHEAIAINQLLDKDLLIDGLLEAGLIDEDKADEYRDGEYEASNVYFLENIPEEVGIAAAGSKEDWDDLQLDSRVAYMKHEGAIQAIGTDFAAWEVTDTTIEAIQGFIFEQTGGETLDDASTEMCIEEYKTSRTVCLPVMEFLTLKTTKELWLKIETLEMWESVTTDPKDNPVRRKTDDKRFGEDIRITDYFLAGSPKAFEALSGAEFDDATCVRCGAKIKHVFMTQYGPMGGDCIATLTGDDSTRKEIRKVIDALRMSKLSVDHYGGRIQSITIEQLQPVWRKELAVRSEAFFFDSGRSKSRTIAVPKASAAVVAAIVGWAEENGYPVKLEGELPGASKQNPAQPSGRKTGMMPVFVSKYEGLQQADPAFVVADFAVVLGTQYEVIWIPSGMTLKAGLTRNEAKDLVEFLGGTERGMMVAHNEIAKETSLLHSESKVTWREDIPSVLIESFKKHKKGSEKPYKEPAVSKVEYEVETYGNSGREVARLQDEEIAMALALGCKSRMQSEKSPSGLSFVRITRIDPPATRKVLWWAMWDEDGFRTVHKDQSLPFDPDAIGASSNV